MTHKGLICSSVKGLIKALDSSQRSLITVCGMVVWQSALALFSNDKITGVSHRQSTAKQILIA